MRRRRGQRRSRAQFVYTGSSFRRRHCACFCELEQPYCCTVQLVLLILQQYFRLQYHPCKVPACTAVAGSYERVSSCTTMLIDDHRTISTLRTAFSVYVPYNINSAGRLLVRIVRRNRKAGRG